MNGSMVKTKKIRPLLESDDKIIGHVYWTKDHSKFKPMLGNRALSRSQLKKLKKAFEIEQVMTPIIVNEKYEIIDGQHRQWVAKEMGLGIPYIVIDGLRMPHVQMLNSYMTNWTLLNFLYCYVEEGRDAYIEFEKMMSNFGFPVNVCLQLFTGNSSRRDESDVFKDGNFTFTQIDKERAYRWGAMLRLLMVQVDNSDIRRSMKSVISVGALVALFSLKEYDHSIMCDRMAKYSSLYASGFSGSIAHFKKTYLKIYNHRSRVENRIGYSRVMTDEEIKAA